MPLLIRAPLPLLFILYSSHSLSRYDSSVSHSPLLSGDMACASSTEQRKPKTRGILLKGVSQQPDINNLHVCRAESKPLGICGFTWVCVRVCPSIYSTRAVYIFMYHVSYLCH